MSFLRNRLVGLIPLLAVALLGAACGDDASGTTSDGDAQGSVSGEVVISGSSTVEPISALNAEKFITENPDVSISVDGPGTSDGFERFCNGETDISDASRPIDPEEVDACAANGIDIIELKVAIDGLSVITSSENDQVDCLTFHDLYALLGVESDGFESWSDANDLAAELDGPTNAPYPDEPLVVTAPGQESGTYDSFNEIVLEGIAYDERGQSEDADPVRQDYQASANDNVIIEGISGTPSSLGWVGYAFYVQNEGVVKALQIDDGESGCVEPSPETISSGEYPIARDLFIYVNSQKLEENPATEAYVDFYLSEAGLASVSEVGYVDLADEDIEATLNVWESKETGTREG